MNTEEYFLSKEEAETAFHNLVSSGIIKLCVHHQVKSKNKTLRLSVNTPKECASLSKFFKDAQPVFVDNIYTGWFYYPSSEQLGTFAPTIAIAGIVYAHGLVPSRMSWNRSS